MHTLLETYTTLNKDPRVSKYDDHVLRSLEERLLANADDATAITALIDRQKKLLDVYRSVFVCRRYM